LLNRRFLFGFSAFSVVKLPRLGLTTDGSDFTDGKGEDCFIRVIREIRG